MFLWFLGGSFVAVWAVFRSPALDYRLVMLGAVLPLVETAFGRALVLHTLLAPVATLVVVMALTRRRRLRRRRWLGVPIGLFLHLVLDGVWMRTKLFWWPLAGTHFPPGPAPEVARGLPLALLFELLGLAALIWTWERFYLGQKPRRQQFLRTGTLDRRLVENPEGGL